jgi:hypothetical protein
LDGFVLLRRLEWVRDVTVDDEPLAADVAPHPGDGPFMMDSGSSAIDDHVAPKRSTDQRAVCGEYFDFKITVYDLEGPHAGKSLPNPCRHDVIVGPATVVIEVELRR